MCLICVTSPYSNGAVQIRVCLELAKLGFFWNTGGGEPGICDGRMPLSTGQTNTVPPKRCYIPCLAQARSKLRNTCMTVRCRSPDGQRHRKPFPPISVPPIKRIPTKHLNQRKKKHININKFAGLSWDWVGGKNMFMCFFGGSFLAGEKNT